jgi:hypothetical protein
MSSPWQSRSEFLVDQALENALAQSPDELRKMRPVALPQQLNPKRTGLRQSPATIDQVLNIDRYTPTYRSWVSGMPVQSSIMSDRSWSGTARNAMSEGIW